MRIHVKLYASLARLHPSARAGEPLEIRVPDCATVADAMAQLSLPFDVVKIVFVNGRARGLDWALRENDRVGVFPSVGGG